jgi:hypothetical protein
LLTPPPYLPQLENVHAAMFGDVAPIRDKVQSFGDD